MMPFGRALSAAALTQRARGAVSVTLHLIPNMGIHRPSKAVVYVARTLPTVRRASVQGGRSLDIHTVPHPPLEALRFWSGTRRASGASGRVRSPAARLNGEVGIS